MLRRFEQDKKGSACQKDDNADRHATMSTAPWYFMTLPTAVVVTQQENCCKHSPTRQVAVSDNDPQLQSRFTLPRVGTYRHTNGLSTMRLLYPLLLVFASCLQFSTATDIIVDWSPDSILFSKGHLVTKKFAKMRDQIVFDCPDNMPISILMVTKEEAMNCDVAKNYNQSLIGLCTPERKRINFVVRDFSLLPNVPIFKQGNEYYFISTSNGTESGMRNAIGGFCRTHDMRFTLKVSGRSSSKSDVDRDPDILMLFTHQSEPTSSFPGDSDSNSNSDDDDKVNRVPIQKPVQDASTVYASSYPAYVVFPDRLSIVVQSDKELKNVIDNYMTTHRTQKQDYSIYPLQAVPKISTWNDGRVSTFNTEYEIQGTASPLSTEAEPRVDLEAALRKRKGDERRALNHRRQFEISEAFKNSLAFDYEIGYEDMIAASGSINDVSKSTLAVLLLVAVVRWHL